MTRNNNSDLLNHRQMIKTKKYTNTFLPNGIKHYHVSIEVFRPNQLKKLSKDEIESAKLYFDDCEKMINIFREQFISHVQPTDNEQ